MTRTINDLYLKAVKIINKIPTKDITTRGQLNKAVREAFRGSQDLVPINPQGKLGLTLTRDNAQLYGINLFILKTTFTKEKGLKHCIVKINPKLVCAGVTRETTPDVAYKVLEMLYLKTSSESLYQTYLDSKEVAEQHRLEYTSSIIKLNDTISELEDTNIQINILKLGGL